ncbi:MAG: tail fiber domain-containing protein, partial [Chitinophagales bacterium]|nr:tail fiber domain-containing protein [Chitinophagales bacterium]
RMTILGTAGATQGFVGIGTNAPQSPLHLHGTLQLTSAATNAGAGDGLLLRNSVTGGPVDFVQQETNAFRFFTPGSSGVQKMIITSAGEVGIGTMSNPGNRCEIESGNSIQLRLTYTGASSYFTTLGANTNGDFQIFANKGADERGVVIGTNNSSPAASGKLHVVGSPFTNGIYVSNTVTSSTGILVENTGTTSQGIKSTGVSQGVWGIATGNPQSVVFSSNGVKGEVSNSNTGTAYNTGNVAVLGSVTGSGASAFNAGVEGNSTVNLSTVSNYGTYGLATNGATTVGAYGKATGGTANYGLYAEVAGTSSAGTVLNYAGYFVGDAKVTGDLFVVGTPYNIGGTGSWNTSDAILKQNIEAIEGTKAIDWINQLKPSSYYFDTLQFPEFRFPKEQQFGFIAQDIEPIFPNMVRKLAISDSLTVEVVNYQEFIAILAAGLKQELSDKVALQAQVNDLQIQLDALQELVNNCCGYGMRLQDQGSNPSQSIKIVSESTALLGDCKQNPTDGSTIITIKVPEKISEALIIFTDQLGKEVFREVITNRGYSDLNIETSQLENGIYHYSLVADRKVIDTKQLVKQH